MEVSFDGYTSYSMTGSRGISNFTTTNESLQTIPEPSTVFLLGIALSVLVIAGSAEKHWRLTGRNLS